MASFEHNTQQPGAPLLGPRRRTGGSPSSRSSLSHSLVQVGPRAETVWVRRRVRVPAPRPRRRRHARRQVRPLRGPLRLLGCRGGAGRGGGARPLASPHDADAGAFDVEVGVQGAASLLCVGAPLVRHVRAHLRRVEGDLLDGAVLLEVGAQVAVRGARRDGPDEEGGDRLVLGRPELGEAALAQPLLLLGREGRVAPRPQHRPRVERRKLAQLLHRVAQLVVGRQPASGGAAVVLLLLLLVVPPELLVDVRDRPLLAQRRHHLVAHVERHAVLQVVDARLAHILLARHLGRDARLLPPLVLPLPAERGERPARDLALLAHHALEHAHVRVGAEAALADDGEALAQRDGVLAEGGDDRHLDCRAAYS
mmetsp:Transcript_19028/g.62837  ORF Transcript_19028/g.62837 Transcript_19028/m.62837 type:complete len:367 (+) Transcript_19028:43-1143(+)